MAPIVHFVGSIPLPDAESVFRDLAAAVGPYLVRLPDGETGIRKSWIKFLQDVLANSRAIEIADNLPPFQFVQHDGKVVREIPRLRIIAGKRPKTEDFETGYADMAIESWGKFERLQNDGVIPVGVKFQISIPTPIAPTYNNMVPEDRPALLGELTRHFIGEVNKIAKTLPNERISIQWDVCQEVLAWEGYYPEGPVDFRTEALDILSQIGDAVPTGIDLGYHLCYGSPADAHMVLPADSGIMVEMANGVARRVNRSIEYFHMPVIQNRTDDAYFEPMKRLNLSTQTEIYLGLIHREDHEGNRARLAAARRHARVDGVSTECGMARGDPEKFPALLADHADTAKLVGRFAV